MEKSDEVVILVYIFCYINICLVLTILIITNTTPATVN